MLFYQVLDFLSLNLDVEIRKLLPGASFFSTGREVFETMCSYFKYIDEYILNVLSCD